VSRTQEYKV